jgi:transcriptional regulator with GAF, ATPase, and Fis domain
MRIVMRSCPNPQAENDDARVIARVLRETGWNKFAAARRLGVSRTELYGRMRRSDQELATSRNNR